MITTTVRGNVVTFTATPVDENGNPVTPLRVEVAVTYYVNGQAETDTVDLTLSGGIWTGAWDSSQAQGGLVYWSVRASNPSAAQDGQFTLTANPANTW